MLNEKLDQYLSGDYYPFHMPGAKRTDILRTDIPYKRDLTEIEGFDNLNDPKDIFVDMEEKIKDIYKVDDAIISVNGSTNGILSIIRALTYNNKDILIQRSCHKAVYNAIEVFGLKADYIDIKTNDFQSIVDIDYEDFTNKIKQKDYALVLLTSPSYEGYYLDLEKIHIDCKEKEIPLVIDMAHGSHSILFDQFDRNYDIAVTSFHKNLSALTPSAVVLINNKNYNFQIRRNMAIFQSSSPSYVILQSIDEMLVKFNEFYKLKDNLDLNLDHLYNLKLSKLHLVNDENKDRSKILISTNKSNISGEELMTELHERKIEIEMAYPSYVLLISTIFDTDYGFIRLEKALTEIDNKISKGNKVLKFKYHIPKKKYEIYESILSPARKIRLDDSIGNISSQFIYAYPPGIPIITPGEVIDNVIINNIAEFKRTGIRLNISETIAVLD